MEGALEIETYTQGSARTKTLILALIHYLTNNGEIGLSDAYVIHVNYDDLINRINKLEDTEKDLKEKLVCYVTSLRAITQKRARNHIFQITPCSRTREF